jgi:hypothetical protein
MQKSRQASVDALPAFPLPPGSAGQHLVQRLDPAAAQALASEDAFAARPRRPDALPVVFSALRWARYFLINAFETLRCSPQTIPKTGAALFLQPGTGQY